LSDIALFSNLVDLASAALGGSAVGASDDFFAEASALVEPGEPRFDPDRYTERGKWMDGWESRRRRDGAHDYAVVELGVPGKVLGLDLDTRHFVGNHPPFASVDGLRAPRGTPLGELLALRWWPLLSQVSLRAGAQNLFAAHAEAPVSHVRLNVFPDGGEARLRVYGEVEPFSVLPEHDDESRALVPGELFDLVALKNGGRALACSDARFGSMNQLLMPGRARVMGEGWETRRGRPPDHRNDWLIARLAARGTPAVVEIDTNHYRGNFPERCSLEGIDRPHATTIDLLSGAWHEILPVLPLRASTRHFFTEELMARGPLSHVRLNIFPDGGVSRLRIWGKPDA
jgi:allantoicase